MLLWCQNSPIIGFFYKGSRSFNPLNITLQNWISSLWHLSWTFKLMNLEPILLKASLTTILYRFIIAFWTSIEWNELLIDITLRVISTFYYISKWTFVVFALCNMYHFIIWRRRCLIRPSIYIILSIHLPTMIMITCTWITVKRWVLISILFFPIHCFTN